MQCGSAPRRRSVAEGVVPLEFGVRRGGLFGAVVGGVPDRYVHALRQAFHGFHDEELWDSARTSDHANIVVVPAGGPAILGVVPLPIDLHRAARSRAEQIALVEAVRDAPPAESETNYLEWKGTLNLSEKAARAKVASAVLGFSNRMPDVAARAFGGCACMLVGVEPGALAGVMPVDAAKLEAGLAAYVGANVQWRPDYVDVDGKTVLVVTVEPPRWGEPAHPVRKTFTDGGNTLLKDGEILVRHHASTDPAKAADVDALNQRTARRSDDGLAVGVALLDDTPLRRVDLRPESLDVWVRERNEIMLMPLNRASPMRMLGATALMQREYRSEDKYREEVAKYAEALREALPDVLLAQSVLHDAGLLQLVIRNATERTFSGVRVELAVPAGIDVVTWKQDVERQTTLPQAPQAFGSGRFSLRGFDAGLGSLLGPPIVRPLWLPSTEPDGEGTRVVFTDEEVRAEGEAQLPDIWLLLGQDAPEEITLGWEATAKQATKRLSGTIRVPVAAHFMGVQELLADRPESD